MHLHPRIAFDAFDQHLSKFTVKTDAEIEGQYFDRKEIPVPQNGNVPQSAIRDIKEAIQETVSAFANSNADGGLLVIGISKTGEIRGLNHLTDTQKADISNIGHLLRHSSALVRWCDCVDVTGRPNTLMLIYVPFTSDAICETLEAAPRAWKRAGPQNLLLSERDRGQLRRDKKI